MSFFCSFCGDSFRLQGGLTKHVNSKHHENSTLAGMAAALQSHTFIRHPHLSGIDLSQLPTLEESCGSPWLPFSDVQQGLDLWRATAMIVPWKSAAEMYGMIDSIPVGGVGWMTCQLSYSGPLPTGTPPRWMQETYELNVRDVLSVFEEQLASKEFDGEFEYMPYEEYDEKGSHVYSNLMSGNWVFREADMISQDKNTHGAMFVPIIAGSDKTTVSIATGNQEYHPVWLTGIVSNWCPKCDVLPTDLDGSGSHQRSHVKTDLLIKTFDPSVLWDNFGLRHNIVPFTYSFPRADIHELLAPDLLHQLIKGVFKDHLVEWVLEYLHLEHGEKRALEIIEDVDRRCDGRDYKQWTGDDSKALMKVFLAAIAGYVPSAMVRCIAAFMDACYIARQNAIDLPSLEHFRDHVQAFHQLRIAPLLYTDYCLQRYVLR
ncbi:hypothetical protein BJY52DRAFT_1206918 [Lactarius psammicola]|nr:hypothetical protein BJY52DRAFT_1206918 [Lactarius psammicola]